MANRTLWIVLGIIGAFLILMFLSSNNKIVDGENTTFIQINSFFDKFGNPISEKALSVVNGVEGVKYITLKINVKNLDTVPLTFLVSEFTVPTAKPTSSLIVGSSELKSFVTGLIDVEPYEGTTKQFCATVVSEKIPALREANNKSGCVNIRIDPNPSGNFNVTVEQGSSSNSTVPPAQCIPNWSCTAWGTCNNGIQGRSCTDVNNCNNQTGMPATTQSCTTVPPQTVYFRTNSVDGNYPAGSWVAYDSNNDGTLECFAMPTSSSTSASAAFAVTLTDMYSKSWSYRSSDMYVLKSTTPSYSYNKFSANGAGCDLSTVPVASFSGKELYR